ncbi:MAG: diguanylate cyclase [Holophagales bacterium]|nr:diguanylate cyclase [Holophagales bacterium]
MRARPVLLAAVTLAAALLASPAAAVRSAVRVYTARDGLPQLQVTAVCQDREGFIWVGTLTGGLGRYDGHRFEIFDAATGLPGSSIQSLSLGPAGEVLAATTNGAAVFESGSWTVLPLPSGTSPTVNTLLALPDGRLYAGASGGLFVASSIGGPFEAVPSVGDLAGAEVVALLPTSDGVIWTGTTRGLARLLPGGALTRVSVPGLPNRSVGVLAAAAQGGLLVGVTESGLFEVDPDLLAARRVGNDEAPGRNVSGLVREAEGGATWIATSDQGAYRWDGASSYERFGMAEGLPDARVWAAFEDREGILWFGTDSGLARRGPAAFRTFGPEDGLPEASPLYNMAETPDGALWIGAHDRGIVRRAGNGVVRVFTAKDGLPHSEVSSFCVAPSGDVIVATSRGLARISGEGVRPYPLPEGAPRRIDSIAFSRDGALLLGTVRQGLFVVREGNLSRAGKPVGDSVSVLHVASDGTVWVGGLGWGVAGLKDGSPPQSLRMADGLPSDSVTAIFQDRRNGLWVGTDRGLFWRAPDGKTRVFDARSGLPDSYIYWAGEDREGFVWAGTNRGAVRIAPSGETRAFTSNDGLGSNECNEGGFFVDSRGRVWITTDGLSLFQGIPTPRRPVPPLVAVSEIRVGKERLAREADLLLPFRHAPVTFRFAALSFLDEGATTFRYRLTGLSDSWTAAQPGQAEMTYGALAAGEYVFEVTATTVDGRSSDAPASVRLTVETPWWQRLPVLLGGLAAVAFAAALVVRGRERRLVSAAARLEETVSERTDELRRLNEQLSELAITDALTGLPNRRSILDSAEEAFSLARRRSLPLSVAMIDFDHFKEFNDAFGHAEGDRLLAEGAQRMSECLRTEDAVGRYGGEEFLAVFPMTGPEGTFVVGERLRRAVSEVRPSASAGGQVPGERATVSVGVASLSDADRGLAELLKRADAALYEAKQAGRNRVVCR